MCVCVSCLFIIFCQLGEEEVSMATNLLLFPEEFHGLSEEILKYNGILKITDSILRVS